MPRLTRLIAALALTGLLAGCQPGLPGKGPTAADPEGVTANAITGEAIEVTALDEAPAGTPPPAEATGTAAPQEAAPAVEAPAEVAEPAPQPDLAEPVPETPKSAQQLSCEKKGGDWSRTGKGSFRICIYPTRDGGKQCSRESQCDGVCLARSGTCSPLKPLIGCNEILQDNGARVTLCID